MDKPKVMRAPSPYILFASEMRKKIKQSHPNATFGEQGRMIGTAWANLSESQKAVYIKESAARKMTIKNPAKKVISKESSARKIIRKKPAKATSKTHDDIFDEISEIDNEIANLIERRTKLIRELKLKTK